MYQITVIEAKYLQIIYFILGFQQHKQCYNNTLMTIKGELSKTNRLKETVHSRIADWDDRSTQHLKKTTKICSDYRSPSNKRTKIMGSRVIGDREEQKGKDPLSKLSRIFTTSFTENTKDKSLHNRHYDMLSGTLKKSALEQADQIQEVLSIYRRNNEQDGLDKAQISKELMKLDGINFFDYIQDELERSPEHHNELATALVDLLNDFLEREEPKDLHSYNWLQLLPEDTRYLLHAGLDLIQHEGIISHLTESTIEVNRHLDQKYIDFVYSKGKL